MKPNKLVELVLRQFFFTASIEDLAQLSAELLRSRKSLKTYLLYMRNLHHLHRITKAARAQPVPEKMPDEVKRRLLAQLALSRTVVGDRTGG